MRKTWICGLALLAACSGGDKTTPAAAQTATSNGQQVEVSVHRVIDPASDTTDLEAGMRYVAVEFSVTNIGDQAFTETRPDSDAVLIAEGADPEPAALHQVSDCAPFPDDVSSVPPGEGLRGCVTFEVPADAALESFQYFFGETLTFPV
jgi:hypothetical protein